MSDANPGKVPDADPIILFVTGNYKRVQFIAILPKGRKTKNKLNRYLHNILI